jgi:hypothetical protein
MLKYVSVYVHVYCGARLYTGILRAHRHHLSWAVATVEVVL